MYVLWLTAFLWAVVGGILWYRTKTVNAWEWIGGAATAFILAGTFQYLLVKGMCADTETWSGQLTEARRVPAWLEHYVYYTTHSVGSGKTRTTVTIKHTATQWHQEHWILSDNLGRELEVSDGKYREIVNSFGGRISKVPGTRRTFKSESYMLSGDPMDYVTVNDTRVVEPVTNWHFWQNKVKACPSVFSFPKVPQGTEVFEYPSNGDTFNSDRLLGTANTVALRAWDQMNARLGPTKQVNVILVGFGNKSPEIAQWQKAKWVGGKKNDLVLCYGGGTPTKPAWTEVFGWTKSELCKSNLKTILLENPITTSIVPLIENEINARYTIRDWTDFDYLTVEPPTWGLWLFFIVVGAVQGGLYYWFASNEYDQEDSDEKPKYRGTRYSRERGFY